MSVNGQLILQFTIAQNFYLLLRADKAVRAKQIGSHRLAGRKCIQILQIDDRKRFSKGAAKTALGNAAMQRHLSAFKAATARITATGLLSFVAFAGSPPKLGADTAADTHFALARTARGTKRFQVEPVPRFLLNL